MEFLYKAGSNDPAFLLYKIAIFIFTRVNIDIFINIKRRHKLLLLNEPQNHKIQKMQDDFKNLSVEEKQFIAKCLDVSSTDEVDALITKMVEPQKISMQHRINQRINK
ncbi:TPA: hypothetical protein ACN69G_002449 [Klebsiella pneumoniae]